MTHTLPELPYTYDSLEPFIDEQTMHIHHDKHHQGYVDKLNAAVENNKDLQKKSVEELLKNLDNLDDKIKTAIKNNGGGHANHSLFWPLLKKDVEFSGEIKSAIEAKFGNFNNFKTEFTKAASTVFGSGWAWLVTSDGQLDIMTTANQDSPLSYGKIPILGLDVWEHAYYLKYQNKRPDYIEAFFSIINWNQVNENFAKASQ